MTRSIDVLRRELSQQAADPPPPLLELPLRDAALTARFIPGSAVPRHKSHNERRRPMKVFALIIRLRQRTGVRRNAETTVTLSIREWADLPVYHPLRRD